MLNNLPAANRNILRQLPPLSRRPRRPPARRPVSRTALHRHATPRHDTQAKDEVSALTARIVELERALAQAQAGSGDVIELSDQRVLQDVGI